MLTEQGVHISKMEPTGMCSPGNVNGTDTNTPTSNPDPLDSPITNTVTETMETKQVENIIPKIEPTRACSPELESLYGTATNTPSASSEYVLVDDISSDAPKPTDKLPLAVKTPDDHLLSSTEPQPELTPSTSSPVKEEVPTPDTFSSTQTDDKLSGDPPIATNTENPVKDKQPTNDLPTRPICLLVLGPAGSGKSTFIAKLLGRPPTDPMIGHTNIDSHTTTITPYSIPTTPGTPKITIIDTPGLTPDDSLTFLFDLATRLTFLNQPVDGVILTHPITLNRLTNSTRQNLKLVKSICGPQFFASRSLLLTTMWDQAGGGGPANDTLLKREAQLLSSPNFWGANTPQNIDGSSGESVRFLNDDDDDSDGPTNNNNNSSANKVLSHFFTLLNKQDDTEPSESKEIYLLFGQEILAGTDVKQTTAGQMVIAEQEERQKKIESEMKRVKEEEEEKLRELKASFVAKLGSHGSSERRGMGGGGRTGRGTRSQQYQFEDGMAYGPLPMMMDDERGDDSGAGRRAGNGGGRGGGRAAEQSSGVSGLLPNTVRGLWTDVRDWASKKLEGSPESSSYQNDRDRARYHRY
ncbi:P-loop containing nucleoside triphosphate hydrolase protein [Cladorrhinum sp. PSN259]|nr:P-loop containing nucleoside triphosphate hydrolase protein [Cladorrhinum sp. PSN259]